MARARHTAGRLLALVVVINFVTFLVVGHWLGGSAWNGKVEAGKFFLADHGRYTEVTEGVYWYSWWHTMIASIGLLLGMPVAFLLGFGREQHHQKESDQAALPK